MLTYRVLSLRVTVTNAESWRSFSKMMADIPGHLINSLTTLITEHSRLSTQGWCLAIRAIESNILSSRMVLCLPGFVSRDKVVGPAALFASTLHKKTNIDLFLFCEDERSSFVVCRCLLLSDILLSSYSFLVSKGLKFLLLSSGDLEGKIVKSDIFHLAFLQ